MTQAEMEQYDAMTTQAFDEAAAYKAVTSREQRTFKPDGKGELMPVKGPKQNRTKNQSKARTKLLDRVIREMRKFKSEQSEQATEGVEQLKQELGLAPGK